MSKIITFSGFILVIFSVNAQSLKPVKLNPPDKSGGLPVMQALSLRSSANAWDTTTLKLQDLSDMLWAADGINRTDVGKRTAPSAMNAQDIDIYVFMKPGTYLYRADQNELLPVAEGDSRNLVADRQPEVAVSPVICLMVSDISRFKSGSDSLKLVWAAIDAGTISQNISIFCASAGLSTRPRVTMNQQKLRELLNLKNTQYMIINNPVSHRKD